MIIYEDGREFPLSEETLKAELEEQCYELVAISRCGELVVDDYLRGEFAAREVWHARPLGYPDGWTLAGMQFEFVRGVDMSKEIYPQ